MSNLSDLTAVPMNRRQFLALPSVPKKHQPLSVGALQHPGRSGVRLTEGLTFTGSTICGGTITLTVEGQSVTVETERGESTESIGSKLRKALRGLP